FFQQYRLFFRYHAQARVIVYGWVNDEDSKRAYGTVDDAYRVFRRMLDSGHPPSDWDSLMAEVRTEGERLARIAGRPEPEPPEND
ncbi:MAG: type II toxin-antitoxin system YhaV family toxin, partial [Gemmatimonadales bacterium]|nr:type II toxin-antitoxin system YhaV family toxin [Gemmatimonadales bacterium]